MEKRIDLVLNPTTLVATLDYPEPDPRVINELKLLLSNAYPDLEYRGNTLTLPWYVFKRALVAVSRLLKSSGIQLQFDDLSLKLVNDFLSDRNSLKKPAVDIPTADEFGRILKVVGFRRTLKPEQLRDALKLLSLKHGANFSVPGAGKTATILAIHTLLKYYQQVSTLFVIAPINAFISWEDEIKSIFSLSLRVVRITTNLLNELPIVLATKPDVLLINYEKMRKDIGGLTGYFLLQKVHLVLDESHRIKSGSNNLSYAQIIRLSDLAVRRDILSGTPMPQSYYDLVPQMEFLWPAEKLLHELPKINEDHRIAEVNTSLKGLYVRTTKNELGLANPTIAYTPIVMGPLQTELYQLFKSEAARQMAGMDNANRNNFRRIGRRVVKLLQAATNPLLLGAKDDYAEETQPLPDDARIWQLLEEFVTFEKPAKLEFLKSRVVEVLSESRETKIVIWSYFIRNIQLIERLLKEYNPVTIYGGIPTGTDEDENNRESRIRKFHADKSCRLMIANPQACGEGISLHTVCHYAIYLDRNFNAAHFLQSIDRIHRLGLDERVETRVEILVAEGTIDEVLIRRLNDKILAMGEILDDTYLKTLVYDPADISAMEEDGIDSKDFDEIKKHVTGNE